MEIGSGSPARVVLAWSRVRPLPWPVSDRAGTVAALRSGLSRTEDLLALPGPARVCAMSWPGAGTAPIVAPTPAQVRPSGRTVERFAVRGWGKAKSDVGTARGRVSRAPGLKGRSQDGRACSEQSG